MQSFARSVLAALVLMTSALALFGASKAEERAYNAAMLAFQNEFWDRAEREFGAFAERYPKAENLAEANLFRAEARLRLKNYSGAIELLELGRATAGALADEYAFWHAEAQRQGGKLEAAADLYARLIAEFPNSTRVLEAVVAEASTRAQLKQAARVIELLNQPDGTFQKLTRANPAQPFAVRGRLLLANTQFELGHFKEAEAALAPLADVPLNARPAWDRDHLLAQIRRADKRPAEALKAAAQLPNLLTNEPPRVAEGWAMIARCEEDQNHPDQAVLAWQQVLKAPGAPAEQQHEALLRVGDLLLAQNRIAESLQTLDGFLATATNSSVADVAWLAVGELRLRQFATAAATNENLAAAASAFDTLLSRYPRSPLAGKAQLGRGWCLWLAERIEASGTAFMAAVASLEPGLAQTEALFKLADVRARQKDYAAALRGYREVVASGDKFPAVRSKLVERALYQILQVAREAGDEPAAGEAMDRLLREFPDGEFTEPGLLTFGNAPGHTANPQARRSILEEFLQRSPDSTLAGGVRLAIARTYEQERDWTKAAGEYATLLANSPEPETRTRAEYFRALAIARSGDETNALTLFTNFVANYPTNEFSALAQWWVADHFWRDEDFKSAELHYQRLADNNPNSPLRYEAMMMAGRAAIQRERPEEALSYFTNLTSDANCPAPIQAQALFASGDAFMAISIADTNLALANYREAAKRFSLVAQLQTNSPIGLLALGKVGECYLQLGATEPGQYEYATNAFFKVMHSSANVTARSEAEVGYAVVLEKLSLLEPAETNRTAFVQRALDNYLNVVDGTNLRGEEASDPYWVKRAGLEALRLAESAQAWPQVAKLCTTLSKALPTMQPALDKKRVRAEEQLKKSEN